MLQLPKSVFYTNNQGMTLAADLVHERDQRHSDDLLANSINIPGVIYGLGFGNHFTLLQALLEKYPQYTNYGVMGLARGRHHEHSRELAGDDKTLKQARIEGYAQAHDAEQVNFALSSQEGAQYLLPAIRGYAAYGNDTDALMKLLSRSRYYLDAMLVAAECGNADVVEQICNHLHIDLTQVPDKPVFTPGLESDTSSLNKLHTFNSLLHAYAKGRHYKQAAALIERGVSLSFCISGFEDSMDSDPTFDIDDDINLLMKHLTQEHQAQVLQQLEDLGETVEMKDNIPDIPPFDELKQSLLSGKKPSE